MTADLVGLLKEALPFIDTHPDLHRPGGDELSERIAAALNSHSDELRALAGAEVGDEYMCPNCNTPWKCNGPHIPQSDSAIAQAEAWLLKAHPSHGLPHVETILEALAAYDPAQVGARTVRTPPPGSGRGGVES